MAKNYILVQAGSTRYEVEDGNSHVSEECMTIANAKGRAKYLLTEEYVKACEVSEPLSYSRVLVNGEIVADYFRDERERKLLKQIDNLIG